MVNNYWLVVWNMNFMDDFSIYWECHHPNWRTPSFFRGVGFKPPTILGCPPFFVSTPQIWVMIFQRWWQSLALPRWCFCGSAAQRQPWNPVVKWRCYDLEVNVATWHHAAFSLPVRNSNFYFIFQVFEVQVKFFGRVLFPFHATWTWKVGNCKQCPFHVHYVSIFLWSKLCCLVHIFSTFFQPFFKQVWDDDLLFLVVFRHLNHQMMEHLLRRHPLTISERYNQLPHGCRGAGGYIT